MAFVSITVDGRPMGRQGIAGEIVVGRSPECGVCVPDARVSRRHVRFVQTNNAWLAEDLGSRNGTIIDGQPITRHLLRDGDVLELGGVAIRFHVGAMPASQLAEDDIVEILSLHDSGALDAIVASEPPAPIIEIPAPAPSATTTKSTKPYIPRGKRDLWEMSTKRREPKPITPKK